MPHSPKYFLILLMPNICIIIPKYFKDCLKRGVPNWQTVEGLYAAHSLAATSFTTVQHRRTWSRSHITHAVWAVGGEYWGYMNCPCVWGWGSGEKGSWRREKCGEGPYTTTTTTASMGRRRESQGPTLAGYNLCNV